MTSTRSHPEAASAATRRALLDRMGELKPALERRLRLRLPEGLSLNALGELDTDERAERIGIDLGAVISARAVLEYAEAAWLGPGHDAQPRRSEREGIVRLELSSKGLRLMSRWGAVRRQALTAAYEVLSDRQLTALIDILETLAAGNPAAVRASLGGERTA